MNYFVASILNSRVPFDGNFWLRNLIVEITRGPWTDSSTSPDKSKREKMRATCKTRSTRIRN